MIRGQRFSTVTGAIFAAVVALLPGCTLFDEVLPGTPFTPDPPKAEVTVVGKINIDSSGGSVEDCPAGAAVLWGIVRNTGDLDVSDVYIVIDALGAGNNVLDSYRVNVFNGDITGGTETDPNKNVGTSLTVDQSGTFMACTRLAFGAVAGTAYRTDFTVINEIK